MPIMNSDNNTDYMAALTLRGNDTLSAALGKDLTVAEVLALLGIGAGTGRLIGIQVFTASGTYTPSVGVNNAFVEAWGSGAGASSSNSETIFGSGGGAGAYAASYVPVSGAVPIVIGTGGTGALANNGSAATAGGDTTYDSTVVVAKGGSPATAGNMAGVGGAAASCTGTIKINGGDGCQNTASAAGFYLGGGSSPRNSPTAAFNQLGTSGAANTGQGGSMGNSVVNAGNGGSGYLIVWEYS